MGNVTAGNRRTARIAASARRRSTKAILVGVLFALMLETGARAAPVPPPRSALMQARAAMHALVKQASSPSEASLAAAAARALAQASVPSLWLDARDAVAPAYGAEVFTDSVAALGDLERLARLTGSPSPSSDAIALVVRADRDLAQRAIGQARGGSRGMLVAATRALSAGDAGALGGHFASAVRSYAKAWGSAFHALAELVAARATRVPSSALTAAAEGALGSKRVGLAGPMILPNGFPTLSRNGKPELFFAGVEPCPFCAVQRWGMIVALSQFGTFSNLSLMQSAPTEPPVIRTFTFFGSSYRSRYLSFVPVEVLSNVPHGFGFRHLQHLTPAQSALVNQFDPPGQTPFIDVANRFVTFDSMVQPGLLRGMTWTQIAGSLRHPMSIAAQAIAGEAEELTAELCLATSGKPASVCSAAIVHQYEAALPLLNGRGGGCPISGTTAAVAGPRRARSPRAYVARCHTF